MSPRQITPITNTLIAAQNDNQRTQKLNLIDRLRTTLLVLNHIPLSRQHFFHNVTVDTATSTTPLCTTAASFVFVHARLHARARPIPKHCHEKATKVEIVREHDGVFSLSQYTSDIRCLFSYQDLANLASVPQNRRDNTNLSFDRCDDENHPLE